MVLMRGILLLLTLAPSASAFRGGAAPSRSQTRRHATSVDASSFAGERLKVTFSCFNLEDKQCLVELTEGGEVLYSMGMISERPGEWRVVAGDPSDGEDPKDSFLEFSQPLTFYYSDMFNIPSKMVFWRGKIDGTKIVEGLAISENAVPKDFDEWWALLSNGGPKAVLDRINGPKFTKEGTFTAEVLTENTPLPKMVDIQVEDKALKVGSRGEEILPEKKGFMPKQQPSSSEAPTTKKRKRKTTSASS